MTDLENYAASFVSGSKGQWAALVRIARKVSPKTRDDAARVLSQAAGVGKSTLARKFESLHAAMNTGLTDEQLIEMGQRAVMAKFVKDKREKRSDKLVPFPHRLTQPVRDDLQELCLRLGRILKVRTYDECFELILSIFVDMDDDSVRHLAGLGDTRHESSKVSGPVSHPSNSSGGASSR